MEDYSKNIIKQYKHWTVYACINQEYLGWCVIWCDRENANSLLDIKEEEIREFFEIIKDVKISLDISFVPDWINYSFLGNSDRHLHCHLVPRYKEERVFANTVFKDKRWGMNWLMDDDFIVPKPLLMKIKDKIQENLPLEKSI